MACFSETNPGDCDHLPNDITHFEECAYFPHVKQPLEEKDRLNMHSIIGQWVCLQTSTHSMWIVFNLLEQLIIVDVGLTVMICVQTKASPYVQSVCPIALYIWEADCGSQEWNESQTICKIAPQCRLWRWKGGLAKKWCIAAGWWWWCTIWITIGLLKHLWNVYSVHVKLFV